MSSNKKKLKMGQILWLGVTGVGSLLILITIVSSLLGVSTPHPSDPVQTYACGNILSPVTSTSDSKYATDVVCRDAINERRGGVFWMTILGWILSVGGVVMLVRSLVYVKPVAAPKDLHE